MNNYNNIIFEIRDDYYFVKINRPQNLNALNQDTISELKKCFDFIKNNYKDFYAVILTGEGEKSFVAGADIKEFTGLNQKVSIEFCKNGHGLFNNIETMPIPVIALVNGYALGGGCELALSCHFRFATKNAQFSQPEINLGIIPGYGGTQRLTQIIGKSKALEMMLTAQMITSDQAFQFGLVNGVVKDNKSGIQKCEELIKTLKRKAPVAIKNIIKSVNNFYDINSDGFEEEINLFSECTSTSDFDEGVKAFIEKRCPDFKGE
jgi:enoyl-CoA hydratase